MNRMPFFLPMRNCPNRCVYCDQRTITGHMEMPAPYNVKEALSDIEGPLEVCFFGGSFTCLPGSIQREYLEAASVSAPSGRSIRISTHPTCISHETLSLLAEFPVSIVELGISSLDDNVLRTCNRGYSGSTALKKISLLLEHGRFIPGVQMMTGLPGQTVSSSLEDIKRISRLKGERRMQLRIYPCLVLRGTPLEEMLDSGNYEPLGIADSARWAGNMIDLAHNAGFELLRVGLQETGSLGEGVVAGPHHPSLGEFARAYALTLSLVRSMPSGPWEVSERSRSLLYGHDRWGLSELARLSGLDPEEAGRTISWSR